MQCLFGEAKIILVMLLCFSLRLSKLVSTVELLLAPCYAIWVKDIKCITTTSHCNCRAIQTQTQDTIAARPCQVLHRLLACDATDAVDNSTDFPAEKSATSGERRIHKPQITKNSFTFSITLF